MELYQLRTFVAVAETRNLTRAAKRLNASGPAVSAQIKALEEELGVELFCRTAKGMLPTEAGRELASRARRTLESAGELLSAAGSFRSQAVGVVRIGLNNEPGRLRMTEFLARMRSDHPRVELHLMQHGSPEALDGVRSGELDGGFVYENIRDPAGDVASMPLCRVEMAIVGPAAWRERIEAADWGALSAMPWVWFPERCPFQFLLTETFAHKGFDLNKTIVGDTDATLRALVVAQCGLTLLRRDDALDAAAAGEVCLWEREPMSLDLSFMYRRVRENDPVIRALCGVLAGVWGDESGACGE
ncbi:LysR family transcriptional regulator [Desulfolutivibrio sulfoxidireducens]|uniref:LysR family transcriptional regulator n=1 Tax=Desulfolutivibrio sulfoxidireducens TaxID=2773299 RepID=UPI00159E29AA|nr:LysR family transcriptional regulator [Desulfolutivibrio sulfoxidireducens]QLA21134.1 LysR family transcriptional regulator [Desulfolutivibrio sulfoxidireducens]